MTTTTSKRKNHLKGPAHHYWPPRIKLKLKSANQVRDQSSLSKEHARMHQWILSAVHHRQYIRRLMRMNTSLLKYCVIDTDHTNDNWHSLYSLLDIAINDTINLTETLSMHSSKKYSLLYKLYCIQYKSNRTINYIDENIFFILGTFRAVGYLMAFNF